MKRDRSEEFTKLLEERTEVRELDLDEDVVTFLKDTARIHSSLEECHALLGVRRHAGEVKALLGTLSDRIALLEKPTLGLYTQAQYHALFESILVALQSRLQSAISKTTTQTKMATVERSAETVKRVMSEEQRERLTQLQMVMPSNLFEEMDVLVTSTEASISTIASLQATLAYHLSTQDAHLERLWEDAQVARDQVGRANRELEKAKQGDSTSLRNLITTVILLLALMILLLHLVSK